MLAHSLYLRRKGCTDVSEYRKSGTSHIPPESRIPPEEAYLLLPRAC